MPEFLKVSKVQQNSLKLCTNDRSCCRWWKKFVWSSLHTSLWFCRTLQDFTYIAFKDLLCGNCIVLAIHHIESNSFETFHASSNHCLFMRKLTLGHLWCTTERLLEIACDSNIFSLSFLSLNFWKFQKSNKIVWNFAQMTEAVVIDEKN